VLPYQQPYVQLHCPEELATNTIHRKVEHNIGLMMPNLRGKDVIELGALSNPRNPWNHSSPQTELPLPIRGHFEPVLCPRPLHRFVVHIVAW
jgi:hypothetical protein